MQKHNHIGLWVWLVILALIVLWNGRVVSEMQARIDKLECAAGLRDIKACAKNR